MIPRLRHRPVNSASPRGDGDYVLYWMTANRRVRWNFALERAVEWSLELGKPLVVLEALRCDYRWASDRLHRFVLDGMRDNRRALEGTGVLYHPYVEPERGHGRGLLEALSERACVVVADDYPCFFLPRMVAAAGAKLDVLLEQVDANGLLPLAACDRVFARAHDFRRELQRRLPAHLADMPALNPLARKELPRLTRLPSGIASRWPSADAILDPDGTLDALPIDHAVPPAPCRGGMDAGDRRLKSFLEEDLPGYGERRNEPEADATSGLSPYLHFGHVSIHQVFDRLRDAEGWTPDRLSEDVSGKREGWWGLSAGAEKFLDEAVTWREVGFNLTASGRRYDTFDSLPDWARETLLEHSADERPELYDPAAFETARTHDELWNAAQNQLRAEGRIHNYLRMLWGKKILHWSEDPVAALEIMIELNNKYALDGRDPNSYTGICWVLGRYDRPWGPERPVFGKVRYMTSQSTRRKYSVDRYVARWNGSGQTALDLS